MKNFERELPEGYKAVKEVDAKQKKFIILMNLVTIVIFAAIAVAGYMLIQPANYYNDFSLVRNIVFIVAIFAYIVLHEIAHGIAYKVLTKEKLNFGLTLSVAYCGVPDIYVYRKTALIALLAPFVIFTILFGAFMLLLPGAWNQFYACVLFAFHISGCSGDIYDTILYLFKFKDPETLMRDTGPKQVFYVKE